MALFSKESDKNVKPDQTARVLAQSPHQPQAAVPTVTPTLVSTGAGPTEKPATPIRGSSNLPADARAYLDSGSKISGKLAFDGPTRIDGQVDGEITGKDSLMIGESAIVTAQIKATSIIVAGKINGDITAVQRIEIRPSAKVVGNLTAPVLVVHEGALFEGHCAMQPEASQSGKLTVFPKDERPAPAPAERVAPLGVQKQA